MNNKSTQVVDGNFYTHNVTYTERNDLALGLKLINKDYLVDAAVVMASLVTAKDSDVHWDYSQGMGVIRMPKDILSDNVKYAQFKVPNGIEVVPISEVEDCDGYYDYKRAVEQNWAQYKYILTPFDVARGELDVKRHWEGDLNSIVRNGKYIRSINVENLGYGYTPKEVVTIDLAPVVIGTAITLPTSIEVIQPQDGAVIPWDSKSIYRENKLKSRFNDYANKGFMDNRRSSMAANFNLPIPKSKTVRKGHIFEPINYDPRVTGKEAAENINGFARAIQVVKVIENDWFKDYMKVQSKSKQEVIDWIDDGLRHGKSIERIVDDMKNFLEQSKLANERKMRRDGQMLLGKITKKLSEMSELDLETVKQGIANNWTTYASRDVAVMTLAGNILDKHQQHQFKKWLNGYISDNKHLKAWWKETRNDGWDKSVTDAFFRNLFILPGTFKAVRADEHRKQHTSLEDSETISRTGEVSGRDQRHEQGSETSAIKPGYYGKKGSQPIDYIRANNLGFNIGNVIKYVTRAGKKNPEKHIEDLEKAAFYLNEEISILKYPHLHEQRMREHAALEEEYRRKLEDE